MKNKTRYEGYGTVTIYKVQNWKISEKAAPIPVIIKEFEPVEDVGNIILKNLQFAT